MGGGERRSIGREPLALVVLLALAFGALVWLHGAVSFPPSAQTRINTRVSERPDYTEAMQGYRRWPPAYVTLLWSARRAGLDHVQVNRILFCAGLALLWWTARRLVPEVHPAWPTAAYAVASPHLRITSWAGSEPLFVALVLLFLLALVGYSQERSAPRLAALGAAAAALCLTRYFAVFWVLPVGALNVAAAPGPPRRRLAHIAGFGLAALPIGAWLVKERLQTGFFTGMDRFGPRRHDDEVDFLHNVAYTAKSLLYDLLSPAREASHQAMRLSWPPGALDLVIPLAVAVALGAAGLLLWRRRARVPLDRVRVRSLLQSREGLTFQLFASYLVALVTVWTLGNNDPIYGRFLYPSYVLVLLLAFMLYARVKESPALAWPLRGALVVFVGVQTYRTWLAVHDPSWLQGPF